MVTRSLPPARYDYGGDEFVFVELDQEMSLEANFKGMAITQELRKLQLPGIIDICPANASYMVRVEPEQLDPRDLVELLQEIESRVTDLTGFRLSTRVIDVPVFYGDPWTQETLMRFRDRHQDPNATDLEYAARINGYSDVEAFIAAHAGSPWFVGMVGFVPGLPWCFQMVPREQQIEVPKYVRPRTDTPERAVGHGGAFACIYPVRGAGGYQLFGIAPAPIFDPQQNLPDFRESLVLPRPGDILKFRRIDRAEYDAIREQVAAGQFQYRIRPVEFDPRQFFADPKASAAQIVEVLYHD
jgi:urea carboxylase